MTFAEGLKKHLESSAELKIQGAHALAIINSRPSRRRDRRIARMEKAVMDGLRHDEDHRPLIGDATAETMDWAVFPWGKAIMMILKILAAILPFLLAL